MKTNSKKKIVVSALAIAMGAALVGSISGSVAWYQYSTRVSAAIAGTSAGTSRNLQIKNADDSGAEYTNHISIAAKNFRPASVYGAAATGLTWVEHPVYKTALLPEADPDENEQTVGTVKTYYKAEYNFVFKCTDTTGPSTSAQVAKDVYLTELNIVNKSTGDGAKDITPAVRLYVEGTNKFIAAKEEVTTATKGNLDIGGATGMDRSGWSTRDVAEDDGEGDGLIEYKNAASGGDSYTAVAASSLLVGSEDPYSFTNKEGKALTTTKTSGDSVAVKITVWLEGWQPLNNGTADSALWGPAYLAQNFEIQMQFACEADK